MGKHWCGDRLGPGMTHARAGWVRGKKAQRHHRICGFFADVKVTPCCIFRFKPATEIWKSAEPRELRPMLIPNWLRIPHSRWVERNSGNTVDVCGSSQSLIWIWLNYPLVIHVASRRQPPAPHRNDVGHWDQKHPKVLIVGKKNAKNLIAMCSGPTQFKK